MIMRMKTILGMLLLTLPMGMMAQEDDAYFVPSKAKKQAAKEQRLKEQQERIDAWNAYQAELQAQEEEEYAEAPDYHVGKLRNDDEYNRRPSKGGQTLVVEADTVYFKEDPATTKKAPKMEEYYYDDDRDLDYGYSGRLVRFYGGVRSPFYWDYYYDWAYDPWLRYGWSYDPWYYDYYYGWGYHSWYGRPWHAGYYGYYSPWYYGGIYDPWYHGYYYGYGGWHYPSYSVGHTNLAYNRPGRQGALYGGRSSRGNNAGTGLSAMRGQQTGTIRGGRTNTTGVRVGNVNQANNGRVVNSRTNQQEVQRSTSVMSQRRENYQQSTQQRQQTVTQPQRQQTVTPQRQTTTVSTPTRSSSSSVGVGGMSTGSASTSRGGGSFGGTSRAGGGRR